MKSSVVIYRLLSIVFILIVSSTFVMSQNPVWQQFNANQVVYTILEDNSVMWFGTDYGLVKVDRANGDTIYYNKANSGLPDNSINDLAIDQQGNLWVATSNGLASFTGTSWQVYNTSNSLLPSNHVSAVEVDASNVKWAGSWNGLASLGNTGWTFYNEENSGLLAFDVMSLASDTAGNIWIGYSYYGLAKYDGDTTVFYNEETTGNDIFDVRDIKFDGDGNLWISGYYVHRFDGTTWTEFTDLNSGLPTEDAFFLDIRNDNEIWIGTYKGLVTYIAGNWTTLTTDIIGEVHTDPSGDVWISAVNLPAVCRFDGSTWDTTFFRNSPLSHNYLPKSAVDSENNVWIASVRGLNKKDGDNWTIWNISNSSIPSNYIQALCPIEGGILAGTSEGLFRILDGEVTVWDTLNSSLPVNSVRAIAVAGDGAWWIGTEGGGLVRYDGTDWTVYDFYQTGVPIDYIRSLAFGPDNALWIGTEERGLVRYSGNIWDLFTASSHGLPSDEIIELEFDANSNLWIACWSGGMAKFDGTGFTSWTPANSTLDDDNIYDVTPDTDGNIWICTWDLGLGKFDGQNFTFLNMDNSPLTANRISMCAIDNNNTKWITTYLHGLCAYNENGIPVGNLQYPEIMNTLVIKAYPNPVSGQLYIETSQPVSRAIICIFNQQGQCVIQMPLPSRGQSIDTRHLPFGTYIITLNSPGFCGVEKVVKK